MTVNDFILQLDVSETMFLTGTCLRERICVNFEVLMTEVDD